MEQHNTKRVWIVCAANQFTFDVGVHGPETLVVTGVRHWDGLMHRQVKAIDASLWIRKSCEVQGFVDNNGVFLTREEAWMIASNNGQIVRLVGNQTNKLAEFGTLYSENLY